MPSSEVINFIASYPKAGNTWVRLFLQGYFMGHVDINGALITEYDASKYYYRALAPTAIDDPEINIYLRPAVLLHMIEAKRFSPFMLKTHWANVVVNGIRAIPPKLTRTAVYIVRDPRDVAVSFSKHTGKTVDTIIDDMANPDNILIDNETHVGIWLTTWSNHVHSWVNEGVPCIRYEDLKQRPYEAFSDLLEAMKIKRNKKYLKRGIELTKLNRLMAQEKQAGRFVEIGQQDRFFGQGQGWRNVLTDEQIARIEKPHGSVMQQCGYALHTKAAAA